MCVVIFIVSLSFQSPNFCTRLSEFLLTKLLPEICKTADMTRQPLFPALLACVDMNDSLIITYAQKTVDHTFPFVFDGTCQTARIASDAYVKSFHDFIFHKVNLICDSPRVDSPPITALAACVYCALPKVSDRGRFLSNFTSRNPFCRNANVHSELLNAVLECCLNQVPVLDCCASVFSFCCDRIIDGSLAPYRYPLCRPLLCGAQLFHLNDLPLASAVAAIFFDITVVDELTPIISHVTTHSAQIFYKPSDPGVTLLFQQIVANWKEGKALVEIRELLDTVRDIKFKRCVSNMIALMKQQIQMEPEPPQETRVAPFVCQCPEIPPMAYEYFWPKVVEAFERGHKRSLDLDALVSERFREQCQLFARFPRLAQLECLSQDCKLRKDALLTIYPKAQLVDVVVQYREIVAPALFVSGIHESVIIEEFNRDLEIISPDRPPCLRCFLIALCPTAPRFEGHAVIRVPFRPADLKKEGLKFEIVSGVTMSVRLSGR
jgi:hypothetical protein